MFFFRPSTSNNEEWVIKSDKNLDLVILGSNYVAKEFCMKLKVIILL